MESLTEEWRAVRGHEGQYEVSDQGRVRSLDRIVTGKDGKSQPRGGRVLKCGTTKNGYQSVTVAGRWLYVHRLVLEAFAGPCPPRHEACHGNGVKSDNRFANLRWDSRPQNNADRVRHNGGNRGERCGTAKLTKEQALEILASSERCCDLAKRFGVRHTTISRIRNGHRWSHLEAVR